MATAEALLRLGDRYAALGLVAAARSAFERAAAAGGADAARRLVDLALAGGDGRTARRWAEEAHRRAPSPATWLLLARASLAAGELTAARFACAAVLEARGVEPRARVVAYLGRADVADREGDRAGAAAHLLAAVDDLIAPRPLAGPGGASSEDAALADELAARAVSLGRAADVVARLRELEPVRGGALLPLLQASLLAAEQAQGAPGIADGDVEASLERALAVDPSSRPVRLRLALRLSRRRYRDPAARARAIGLLEALADELAGAAVHDEAGAGDADRARVWFLLAGLYEDDPGSRARAEDAYARGLALRPRHAAAANNLALLALGAGDPAAARRELERALRLDPTYDVAWLNAARLLDPTRSAPSLAEDVAGWLDAAAPGAGAAAPAAARLARAAAETATQAVLEALHAKGHRLKNLLGIAGARVRSARKAAANGEDTAARLEELERELGALYEEWAAHLRTLVTEGPRLEIVPVNPLVAEVVAAAAQEGRPALRFTPGGGLPDLRGDRALLREAFLNLVVNALEAQEAAGERERPVEVVTRAVAGPGGAPAVEVEVRDRGAGIARADLARVFVPGFTTKPSGSGLGLAVAHRVVAAHHGRILVESEVMRGTTLAVVLPSDLGGFSSLAPTTVSRAEP